MVWDSKDIMELRLEFVNFATQEGANRRALCTRYGISAKTGYKWIRRFEQGDTSLADRSRRPVHSPLRTAAEVEARVVELRHAQPVWGAAKIARRMSDLGFDQTPSPSTVTRILHRHGLITAERSTDALRWQRFEHEHPNDLWQMDFKGCIELDSGRRCSPFTVLDDHSRFDLALDACGSTPTRVVRERLRAVFRRYGLPLRINADNGPPWGSPVRPGQLTALAIWLIRLGIRISYSRPMHPQTNGKDERFYRTLKAELLAGRHFRNLKSAQQAFDAWRRVYNHERPHQALGMATPIWRYRTSPRPYPERLSPIEYGDADAVVRVGMNGEVRFKSQRFKVSSALANLPIALRASSETDGTYDLYFAHHRIDTISLKGGGKRS
ncbi:Mobile element protein [Candidatus Burkholderia verschuerenii]|uniref:Mobile element protein n=1 Tax=Candidatus Burkholderia verschuerenii TaxID=242163 RepID=A0A0L0M6I0_9BURK|nr:IS481 family transposase [Candidatus Burkholderia verschuerenii]KND57905.1 Mobile element protein [Candidatus Burkholderia verschuerenii]